MLITCNGRNQMFFRLIVQESDCPWQHAIQPRESPPEEDYKFISNIWPPSFFSAGVVDPVRAHARAERRRGERDVLGAGRLPPPQDQADVGAVVSTW